MAHPQDQRHTGQFDEFVQQITNCMNQLDRVLTDPVGEVNLDIFADAIRKATGAEAVSIFTRDDSNPNVLRYAGGVGYKLRYLKHRYFLPAQTALTTDVFLNRTPINMSFEQLRRGDVTVHFTGACQDYLESGEFFNVVAVPILYGLAPVDGTESSAKALGVLKMENQGKDRTACFREDSFALARILARVIAVALEQRRTATLWKGAEEASLHRRNSAYLHTVAELIRSLLHAEAVAVYRSASGNDGDVILRREVVVGNQDLSPPFRASREFSRSSGVLADVAGRWTNKSLKTEVLDRMGDDPLVQEMGATVGGQLRSLLIFSLHSDSSLAGALVAANKGVESTFFDDLDEQVCEKFAARYIVPYILENQPKVVPQERIGYEALIERFGEPPAKPLTGLALLREVHNVEGYRQDAKLRGSKITANDCAKYFGMRRQNYLRRVNQAKGLPTLPT